MVGASSLLAQPGSVQKVAKSVFSLTTLNKDGGIIASTQDDFIDNKGTAISTFKPFIGATKATVVDANGKSMEVDAIMGADELYDMAKFRVIGNTNAAPIASKASEAGNKVWLVPYSIKKPQYQQEDISSVEQFNTSYNYYIFSNTMPENAIGCPFVNKDGQVIGLMHSNGTVTAIDANYAKQLHVTGLSTLDAALRESGIRTALPDKEEDAITMMTLSKGQKSADDNMKYADEFIGKFPTSSFGYKEKAALLVNKQQFEEAEKVMQESIKKCSKKNEAHGDFADLIYQKVAYVGDSIYPAWNADKALQEAQKAYSIKAEPLYKHQEGKINYLKKDYQKAYDLFMELTKTPMNSGEIWYEAAQAKSQLKAPYDELKVLLDSAVSFARKRFISSFVYHHNPQQCPDNTENSTGCPCRYLMLSPCDHLHIGQCTSSHTGDQIQTHVFDMPHRLLQNRTGTDQYQHIIQNMFKSKMHKSSCKQSPVFPLLHIWRPDRPHSYHKLRIFRISKDFQNHINKNIHSDKSHGYKWKFLFLWHAFPS